MKKLLFVMFLVLFAVGMAAAQTYTQGTGLTGYDILGAHQNGGRGCAGCHAPHSGAEGGGGNAANNAIAFNDPSSGSVALFGQDVTPLFGYTLTMGNGIVEVLPSQSAAYTTNQAELEGIMMCLACHDGVVAKGAMMTGQSWEQRLGLLPAVYGPNNIPTLLGDDSGNGNTSKYLNDHPVGLNATLAAVGVWSNSTATSPLKIAVTNGAITSITPNSAAYVAFTANYGYPAIAGSVWDYGVAVQASDNGTGNTAFITCTTCHNQHQMYVYKGPGTYSGSTTPKMTGSSIGVGTYPTYFFINSPYNPGAGNNNPRVAVSTTQFCRQCHFDTANESFGISGVTTQY
jgi:cytochrome c553